MPKRTFQPRKRRRAKTHGFRSRMKTKGAAKSLRRAARRAVIASRPNPEEYRRRQHAGERRALKFPREARLVRRSEYDAVYRAGKRRSSSHFTVFRASQCAAAQPLRIQH